MENKTYVLVMPEVKHRSAALDYITEFINAGDDIDGLGKDLGPGADIIESYDAYGEWLYWLYGEGEDHNCEKNKGGNRKGSFTFFFIEEQSGRIIGTVNLRTTGKLADEFGNLGYAVRPSFRGKGYGTMMVESALTMCGFMGMDRVTAVCHDENAAGLRLLEKCGFSRIDFLWKVSLPGESRDDGEHSKHFKSSIWFERIINND
ncbi:MAG: GNAT family N-acetyltransferase [Lachnospiraceae bacterium]|nr:GNAT family N-acetyltransferase [Lachnospiraceae bacterium]